MHRFTLMLAFLWLAPQFVLAQDSIRKSVVKIHSKLRTPDLLRPWAKQPAREISGTGAIIDGHRILTNAHVVLYASQIMVQADRSTERIQAEVEAIAPGIDLAILKVRDESLFEARPPLQFADDLPKIKDTVNAYGFPIGGEQLSITEGIISRVEHVRYRYGVSGLRIQIDAALNPGNSGGPAIANDKIVGLVFSRIGKADNIGYLIPVEEIRMFLDDIKDGEYQGKPRLPNQLQTVENAALRAKLQLDSATGGMMVTSTYSQDESYPLKTWDVITHVGDKAIDKQGNILVGNELRLAFHYLIPKLVTDGKLPVRVIRDGESMQVEVPVEYHSDLLIPYLKGSYPRHFIVGPLVFTTSSQELVTAVGAKSRDMLSARKSPLVGRRFDRTKRPGEELVLSGPRFPNPIVEGYDNKVFAAVSHVNDVEILNLADLVASIRKAEGTYIVFTFAGYYETMVFDRQELIDSTEQILEDEGIRHQMSPDLRKVWSAE
jgi:S1-C subfamily serine protease